EINDFFGRLRPLGFVVKEPEEPDEETVMLTPDFLDRINFGNILELDVRPILEADEDPLQIILIHLKALPSGQVLKILNTFEPSPLIALVSKKGYLTSTKTISPQLTETYIYKNKTMGEWVAEGEEDTDWGIYLDRYKDNLVLLDVRQLPMPQPMMAILE